MLIEFLALLTADTSRPSKINRINFSQQTLLEMLVDGITDKKLFQIRKYPWKAPEFKPICSWKGVNCTASQDVESVDWNGLNLRGTLDIRFLPLTLIALRARENMLQGSLPFEDLPPSIQTLSLQSNEFMGTVNLTVLPEEIRGIYLRANRLCGSIDLTQLPQSLQILSLSDNELSGSLLIHDLSENIQLMHLQGNLFSGDLDLRGLESFRGVLYLQSNAFSSVAVGSRTSKRYISEINIKGNPLKAVYHTSEFHRWDRALQVDRDTCFVELNMDGMGDTPYK